MNLIYVLSIIYLLVAFLLYKKTDKKLNIITWFIYSCCLLICYNCAVVYFGSFVGIGGNLIDFSVVNFILGSVLLGITSYRKNMQSYSFNKKEFWLVLLVGVLVFFIGFLRFDGFTMISYDSGDPSTHYRMSLHFSEQLTMLNEENSKDLIFRNFNGGMPIFYINCGFWFKLLPSVKHYNAFVMLESMFLVLYALLFVSTLIELFKSKKVKRLYMFILTLIYILAFPLNNLLFGFSYLGIGVMVVNLLLLFNLYFKSEYDKRIGFKVINLFLIGYALFFSYYLYVPCIYLGLGIYYIYLWKKKKIDFKQLLIYGSITLIIPFIIGFSRFMLPSLIDNREGTFINYVSLNGVIYSNKTTIYFYLFSILYLIYYAWKKRKKEFSFIDFNMYILAVYIGLFLFLYLIKFAGLYYLYKLFYLYWLFMGLHFGEKLINKVKVIYVIFGLIVIGMGFVFLFPYNRYATILNCFSMYGYNARRFVDDWVVYTGEELELVDRVPEYRDICEYNNEFVVIGMNYDRNLWFYAITGSIPVANHIEYNSGQLVNNTLGLYYFNNLDKHKCGVFFNKDNLDDYNDSDYEVLFENNSGAILKKLDK